MYIIYIQYIYNYICIQYVYRTPFLFWGGYMRKKNTFTIFSPYWEAQSICYFRSPCKRIALQLGQGTWLGAWRDLERLKAWISQHLLLGISHSLGPVDDGWVAGRHLTAMRRLARSRAVTQRLRPSGRSKVGKFSEALYPWREWGRVGRGRLDESVRRWVELMWMT